ncbi:MAG: hypothetical protein CMP25_01830 [Rickettsiales bacterium]|nr:hypothetical protein [Rickettsiales bacterium]
MKKKLNKSLNRIKKNNPDLLSPDKEVVKLTPYEISLFRQLQKKYDISIETHHSNNSSDINLEISKSVKNTLDRINKGLPFKFDENN